MTVVPEGMPGVLFVGPAVRPMCWFLLYNKDCGAKETWFVCPNGHAGPLDSTHTVDENGKVTPSVVCDECDFHDHVVLEDY